jgi:N-acetylglucosaminyldiphosphoundecaprenol N-acetyl-beta-D-mannosaminyltransferase
MQAITYRGLKAHIGTRADAFKTLKGFLESSSQHQVITLNPEYVVLAARKPEMVKLTHHSSLCVIDGVGLAFALRKFGFIQRYPGADLVPDLLRYCEKQGTNVGIVLSANGLSTPEQVYAHLQRHFPKLQFSAWYEDDKLVENINLKNPVLLLVTFGQPRQDFWILENLTRLSSVKLAIGVGGTIDFLTGVRRRAPRLMRTIGVEWLWRLITQPKRLPRIFRATFGFWYTILFR